MSATTSHEPARTTAQAIDTGRQVATARRFPACCKPIAGPALPPSFRSVGAILDLIRSRIGQVRRADAFEAEAFVFRLFSDLCCRFGERGDVIDRILAIRFACVRLFQRIRRNLKSDSERRSALIALDFLALSLDGPTQHASPVQIRESMAATA